LGERVQAEDRKIADIITFRVNWVKKVSKYITLE
jgi:hypothetical protein